MSRRAPLGQTAGGQGTSITASPRHYEPVMPELPLARGSCQGLCSGRAFCAPQTHAGCRCPHLLPSLRTGIPSPSPPPPARGKASVPPPQDLGGIESTAKYFLSLNCTNPGGLHSTVIRVMNHKSEANRLCRARGAVAPCTPSGPAMPRGGDGAGTCPGAPCTPSLGSPEGFAPGRDPLHAASSSSSPQPRRAGTLPSPIGALPRRCAESCHPDPELPKGRQINQQSR